MNEHDVKRLALVLSCQAELQGMKAENTIRETNGLALIFDYDSFMHVANRLENLANANNEQLDKL